jgi:hypothetical protein
VALPADVRATADARRIQSEEGAGGGIVSDEDELRQTVEGLLQQFAHQTMSGGVPAYTTGGLSALEGAFAVLGWSDPYPVPEMACEWDGCNRWASCGTPTADGYKRLCGAHYTEAHHER